MGPLDLALIGPTIMGGVGDSIDSGSKAGSSGNLDNMRTKEYVTGGLIIGVGAVIAYREKALWPILVAVGVLALIVGLHEYHARKATPCSDYSLVIGGFK